MGRFRNRAAWIGAVAALLALGGTGTAITLTAHPGGSGAAHTVAADAPLGGRATSTTAGAMTTSAPAATTTTDAPPAGSLAGQPGTVGGGRTVRSTGVRTSRSSAASAPSSTSWGTPVTPTLGATAATVPDCDTGCVTDFTVSLPDGSRFVGLHKLSGTAGITTGIVAYWVGDRPVAELAEDRTRLGPIGDVPQAASCATVDGAVQCVATFEVGAHGGITSLFRLSATGIRPTASMLSDTAEIRLVDLDHDGVADVVIEGDDYDPDYATGAHYWQTVLVGAGRLTVTGCTAPTHVATPWPATPVIGTCPG